jgi:hypothetical protein
MLKTEDLLSDFYTQTNKLAEQLADSLPPIPDNKCQCGSAKFLLVGILIERVVTLNYENDQLVAHQEGLADYHADPAVHIATCDNCDTAYNISHKLIGIEWR